MPDCLSTPLTVRCIRRHINNPHGHMKLHTLSILFLAVWGFASAQTSATGPDSVAGMREDAAEAEAEDSETRIAPQMDGNSSDNIITHSSFGKYSFLNLAENRIRLNGRDWSALRQKLAAAAAGDTVFSVVHIGDSHVQPDGNTGRVRTILQQKYGDAGRGLMAPLRMARTNEPLDYKFTTTAPVTTATLMRMPWPVPMGFTGVAVQPDSRSATFTLTSRDTFSRLRIYGQGDFDVTLPGTDSLSYRWHQTRYGGELLLEHPVDRLTFAAEGTGYRIFGVDARNDSGKGILYHNIGNNGATCSTYSLVDGFGTGIGYLSPDLVIVSLGTNEAFGHTGEATMYSQLDRLVGQIKAENPRAEILLTTPSECQRSVITRKRTTRKRRNGKRRSYYRRVRSYTVNANVARMRDVILRYGSEHGIPVYDFYSVAGARGASTKWLANGLMSKDRIHRTWAGYYLEGELLAEALLKALSGPHND